MQYTTLPKDCKSVEISSSSSALSILKLTNGLVIDNNYIYRAVKHYITLALPVKGIFDYNYYVTAKYNDVIANPHYNQETEQYEFKIDLTYQHNSFIENQDTYREREYYNQFCGVDEVIRRPLLHTIPTCIFLNNEGNYSFDSFRSSIDLPEGEKDTFRPIEFLPNDISVTLTYKDLESKDNSYDMFRDVSKFNDKFKIVRFNMDSVDNGFVINNYNITELGIIKTESKIAEHLKIWDDSCINVGTIGSDFVAGNFVLPFSTPGSVISNLPYNITKNQLSLKQLKANEKNGINSIVLLKDDLIDGELKEVADKILESKDLPLCLVEDEYMSTFKKHIANLDYGVMVFHLHFDANRMDTSSALGTCEYMFKRERDKPSIIRPLHISDYLIESLLNSTEVYKVIMFRLPAFTGPNENRTSNRAFIGGRTKVSDNGHDKEVVSLEKVIDNEYCPAGAYSRLSLSRLGEFDRMAEELGDVFFNYLTDDLAKVRKYREDSENGLINKSKLFAYIQQNTLVVPFYKRKDEHTVKAWMERVKRFFDPKKELEVRVKNRAIELMRERGVDNFVKNVKKPTNLLEYLLNRLNNKIIVIEYNRLNTDRKYEDGVRSEIATKESLYNYYHNHEGDEEFNAIKHSISETEYEANNLNFDLDNCFTIDHPVGGSLGNKFRVLDNINPVINLEGYYCSHKSYSGVYRAAVNMSIGYFKTTFIDTKKVDMGENNIVYDKDLKMLFFKYDGRLANRFYTMDMPDNNTTSEISFGMVFKYYGKKNLNYVVNGKVFEIKCFQDYDKEGLYKIIYQNGEVVSEELIPLESYQEHCIFTSSDLANSVAKTIEETKNLSYHEFKELMLESKINHLKLTKEEMDTKHKYAIESLKAKEEFDNRRMENEIRHEEKKMEMDVSKRQLELDFKSYTNKLDMYAAKLKHELSIENMAFSSVIDRLNKIASLKSFMECKIAELDAKRQEKEMDLFFKRQNNVVDLRHEIILSLVKCTNAQSEAIAKNTESVQKIDFLEQEFDIKKRSMLDKASSTTDNMLKAMSIASNVVGMGKKVKIDTRSLF